MIFCDVVGKKLFKMDVNGHCLTFEAIQEMQLVLLYYLYSGFGFNPEGGMLS